MLNPGTVFDVLKGAVLFIFFLIPNKLIYVEIWVYVCM
jgi:hypothetical protein